jgi:hypothetical protein
MSRAPRHDNWDRPANRARRHLEHTRMTEELEKAAKHLVQQFVAQLTELAHRAAVAVLTTAFGEPTADGGRNPGAITVARVGRGGRTKAGRRGARRHERPARRGPGELETLSARFVSFVQANPGLRIEQINKQLGTETKDLALPIRKLVSRGVIRSKGEKRSTRYFGNQDTAGSGRPDVEFVDEHSGVTTELS